MNRLTRLVAPAATMTFAVTATVIAMALPATAAPISLSAISKYLNGMTTAEAKFTQIAGDNSVSTGTLYIKRPGRMRFEYDPPEATRVIASAGAVKIFDPKTESTETYPLSRTPLSIILDSNVDLGRANMVTDHREQGPSTVVRAQDPEHPEYGFIEMVFTDNPVELRQWVVHDDSGSQTTIALGELRTGMNLSTTLFMDDSVTDDGNGR
ncbi:outer membrane lipoprotein carrier protein LolA [Pseudooceanicola sediminis]|uniref:Outer membrane lipoprotein carrier protein LolA n=1 Tax=Pseudooceanicola sediminis TaxID=2211117 RepID=A0A399IYV4_9RHOB|nr:outer membrane lipoprotein carrier protein LolA [Pseudooceanicola sediminis]KAA2313387.1 outer membrane lipoprotein carrier protein LolA [Puniceibacterium sp. HSS470]RII38333.1 outer membrane lipoprotein carrier protein LolA [Pseudooceanicola sediminis]